MGEAVDTVRHTGFSQSVRITDTDPRGEGTELQLQTRKGILGIEEPKSKLTDKWKEVERRRFRMWESLVSERKKSQVMAVESN